jgi:hypothetical protein
MRKFKKVTAVLAAATMVVCMMPVSAFAADSSTGTVTGTGSSEGNNASDVFRVVLPTTTASTYDFIMDPNNLLKTSSLNGNRDAYDGSSVYYKTVGNAATVAAKFAAQTNADTHKDAKLYKRTLTAVTFDAVNTTEADAASLALLKAALTVTDNAVSAVADNAIVIVDGDTETPVTMSNFSTYFTPTIAGGTITKIEKTAAITATVVANTVVYAELNSSDAFSKLTIAGDEITAVNGIYYLTLDGSYVAMTAATAAKLLTVDSSASTAAANFTAMTYANTNKDNKLYEKKETLVDASNKTAALAKFTVTNGTVTAVASDSLYVWAPDSTATAQGLGKWVEITLANYAQYFNLTVSNTAVTAYEYAAKTACDSNLYMTTYAELTAAKAAELATITGVGDAATVTDASKIYYLTLNDEYVSVGSDASTIANLVKLTPATEAYTGESGMAKATNKSTFPVVLNLKVQVKNTTSPVVFTTAAAVEADTKLNVSCDVAVDANNDGTTESSVANVAQISDSNKDGLGIVNFYLDGYAKKDAAVNYSQYQGAANAATGGHDYNYLEAVDATWDAVSYSLKTACNTKADWKEYNNALTAENRIKTDIVYTMSKATVTPVASGEDQNFDAATKVIDVAAKQAVATYTGGIFTITKDGTNGFGATAAVSAVKCEDTDVDFTYNNETGAISIAYEDNVKPIDATSPWTFTFMVDGEAYTATFVVPQTAYITYNTVSKFFAVRPSTSTSTFEAGTVISDLKCNNVAVVGTITDGVLNIDYTQEGMPQTSPWTIIFKIGTTPYTATFLSH